MTKGDDMDKDFYVYEHRRTSDGSVFYVGKGRGRRLFSQSKRNKYWNNSVKKHGFTAHKIYEGLSEDRAFELEALIIDAYGPENLANLTGGGDGMKSPADEVRKRFSELQSERWNQPEYRENLLSKMKGRKHTADTISKMSIAHKGRVRTEEHCKNLSKSLSGLKKSEAHKKKISILKKGSMSGEKNPSFDWTLRFFYSEKKCMITTAWHFANINGFKRYNVDNLIRGKCKIHNGWSYGGML